MNGSPLRLLLTDELVGFAKSKVMIVLWVALPAVATLGFLFLPASMTRNHGGKMPLTYMMGLLLSSLAGTIAAVMVAVDIVSEKQRKVYDLFLIRPIRRESILWAKFFAVFGCVTVACAVSLAIGLVIDAVTGVEMSEEMARQTLQSLGSAIGVVAISTAVGIFFGIVSNSILVAVILILYVGQNLAVIPMVPSLAGWGQGFYWIIMAATAIATWLVMFFAGVLFRRAEF